MCLFFWHLEHSTRAPQEFDDPTTTPPEPIPVQTDDQLQQMVDPILEMMDTNKDGFVSWEEYFLHDQEQKAKSANEH